MRARPPSAWPPPGVCRNALLGAALAPGLGVRDTTTAAFLACVRDRAASRDPAILPETCTAPALQPAEPRAAATLATALATANARIYARAFVSTLGVVITTLFLTAGLLAQLLSTRPLSTER